MASELQSGYNCNPAGDKNLYVLEHCCLNITIRKKILVPSFKFVDSTPKSCLVGGGGKAAQDGYFHNGVVVKIRGTPPQKVFLKRGGACPSFGGTPIPFFLGTPIIPHHSHRTPSIHRTPKMGHGGGSDRGAKEGGMRWRGWAPDPHHRWGGDWWVWG